MASYILIAQAVLKPFHVKFRFVHGVANILKVFFLRHETLGYIHLMILIFCYSNAFILEQSKSYTEQKDKRQLEI